MSSWKQTLSWEEPGAPLQKKASPTIPWGELGNHEYRHVCKCGNYLTCRCGKHKEVIAHEECPACQK